MPASRPSRVPIAVGAETVYLDPAYLQAAVLRLLPPVLRPDVPHDAGQRMQRTIVKGLIGEFVETAAFPDPPSKKDPGDYILNVLLWWVGSLTAHWLEQGGLTIDLDDAGTVRAVVLGRAIPDGPYKARGGDTAGSPLAPGSLSDRRSDEDGKDDPVAGVDLSPSPVLAYHADSDPG